MLNGAGGVLNAPAPSEALKVPVAGRDRLAATIALAREPVPHRPSSRARRPEKVSEIIYFIPEFAFVDSFAAITDAV